MRIHTQELTKDLAFAKFAGIDFHKRTSVVAIGDTQGTLLQQVTLIDDERTIREYFQGFVGLECVIERCRAKNGL
jgi:hypothetical protein